MATLAKGYLTVRLVPDEARKLTFPTLYKYCRRDHMQAMLTRGCVKLGSLSEYRAHEGRMVGDSREGQKEVQGYFRHADSDRYPGLKKMGLMVKGVENLVVAGTHVFAPDQLVLSMSTQYTQEAHSRWREEAGYDACYRVTDLVSFLEAIYAVISTDYSRGDVGPVNYLEVEDLRSPYSGDNPAFVKRPSGYSDQNEFRITWLPRVPREQVSGILVEASEAGRYCEVHAIID